MFLIVCVTFIKGATCFELFKTLLYSKGGFFVLFTSLLDSQRGVFNRLRHFYKASDLFCIL